MNIAMLGHKRIPSREGGIEVVVEALSTRMVEKGHAVTCFNRSGHHAAGAEFDSNYQDIYKGVCLKNVFTINRRGYAAMTSSVCSSIMAAFGRYDVVHIHAEGPAFLCWLPKLIGKKVVVTVHGLDWARAKWGKLASLYIRTGERNAVRFADQIIVLSENTKDYFWNTYRRKTTFIPNGVTRLEKREASEISEKWNLKKDNYILYLGRLVPEKGGANLIKAFQNVNTDKKLVIAGGSSDTDSFLRELKNMVQGDDRILFTGFVQGRIWEELFSNAYLYCLPSDLEGMPLTLLEAMSYGNCCLVSDIPECAEVVDDKAILFRKGDIEDLQEKLQMLCDSPALVAAQKSQSSDFICKKYNWDDVVEKTLQLYQK